MALATRCPHCETVFKLDPHLLAPHDGRVRCGHCQEVFDAAHHRFEIPEEHAAHHEAQHASIIDDDVAVGPPSSQAPTPEPQPQAQPSPPPIRPRVAAPRTLDVGASLAGRPVEPAKAPPVLPPKMARPRPSDDDDRTVYAGTPAFTREPLPEPSPAPVNDAQIRQFVRVNAPAPEEVNRSPEPPVRAREPGPVDDRAEPFIGPTRGHADVPRARPAPTPPPASDWLDDAEPGFGAPPTGGARAESANEAFPVMRESRESRDLLDDAPPRPAKTRGRGWRVAGIVLAVLLALTLIAQIAWWERETVMVSIPGTHALYVDVCDQLECTITPPRDIDGLQIESSGLRQVDGAHKLELKLSLRNRMDVALAWPALELTLLDDKNNVATRRVLWPQDYARPGTIFAIGLPPQSAQPVVIRLDTGDVVAANYRVQVFYP